MLRSSRGFLGPKETRQRIRKIYTSKKWITRPDKWPGCPRGQGDQNDPSDSGDLNDPSDPTVRGPIFLEPPWKRQYTWYTARLLLLYQDFVGLWGGNISTTFSPFHLLARQNPALYEANLPWYISTSSSEPCCTHVSLSRWEVMVAMRGSQERLPPR